MKSVSHCLNIIDDAIVGKIGKPFGIRDWKKFLTTY